MATSFLGYVFWSLSVITTYILLDVLYRQLTKGIESSRYLWLTFKFYTDMLRGLLKRAYESIEWVFSSPPKPHSFVSLPVQSFCVSSPAFSGEEVRNVVDNIGKKFVEEKAILSSSESSDLIKEDAKEHIDIHVLALKKIKIDCQKAQSLEVDPKPEDNITHTYENCPRNPENQSAVEGEENESSGSSSKSESLDEAEAEQAEAEAEAEQAEAEAEQAEAQQPEVSSAITGQSTTTTTNHYEDPTLLAKVTSVLDDIQNYLDSLL